MKHSRIFLTSFKWHYLHTVGFLAIIFLITSPIWGQTPMPMPMPQPTSIPPMTDVDMSKDASKDDMDDDMMGAPGLTPPGIMVGKAGRWMIGYQVMFDKMDGNRIGTREVSTATVLSRFMASPTDMTMQMHMGMVMYSPTDKLTLMAMVPFIRKSMNHVMSDGTRFNELTKGVGDVELRALYVLYSQKDLRHRFLLNAGVGLPTGSIDQKMGPHRLEYPMQLGSGTFSLSPGFTYLGQAKPWGWGAEFIPTLRIGRNNNGYRLGNRYQPSIWGARTLTPWLSLSARLNGDVWRNIRGADPMLDIMDEPTKDPMLQGGKRIDITFGPNIHPSSFKGNEFFVHINKPFYQSLDGPQLQRRWAVTLGWQYEFRF